MSGLFGFGGGAQQSQQAPLAGANIQTSAYGLPVPLAYGRTRLPANIVWFGDFVATPHEQSQSGGKGGGGGSSSTSYTYTASVMWGLGEGAFNSINNVWIDKDAAKSMTGFTSFLGGSSQSAWSQLSTFHPTQALNYRGHAYVARASYDLGNNAAIGNHSFDATTLLPYSAGVIDGANPKLMLADYLTDANHGAGFASTWIGDHSQFSNYCVANSFFISPVYTSQAEARQHITDLMAILNSGVFFSEGKLKVVPFSDTNATGNSVTFTANATPAFSLGDDDYLDLQQPVKVQRTASSDAFNQVQVEFLDSANSYNKAIATAIDQASVEIYGLKPQSIIEAHLITDAPTARAVAQLILQRILYTRNMYEFKIGWKYCQLEPCDYVTLTDTRLGLSNTPVRVLSIEEDETGQLTITAEDAPSGVSHSALYNPQSSSGYVVDFNIACGQVVAPAFFEVPANQSLSGLAVGIAVTGNNASWGGCDVYVSNDGESYSQIKTVQQPARYGTITNSITSAVSQVAAVNLVGNGGQIVAGSASDAANDSTSCVIDTEYVDYTTAALVTTNNYNLTLAVRGAHGTPPVAHSAAEKFIRVDGAIVYSDTLDLSFIGKTIYFKFLSFNIYGGAKTDLASATAYSYTILGNMAKLAPALVTGLTATNSANCIFLSWTSPTTDLNFDHVEIWSSNTNVSPSTGGTVAMLLTTSIGLVRFYSDYLGASGVTKYYWLRTINKKGYPSAFTSSVTATTGAVTATPSANSITNAMIQTDAVQANSIQAGAVGASELAANSVIAGKIAAGSITAAGGEIGNLAVNTLQIAGQAVTIPSSSYTEVGITLAHLTTTVVQTITITSTGAPATISFSCSIEAFSLLPSGGVSNFGLVNFILKRGATVLGTWTALHVNRIYDAGSNDSRGYAGGTGAFSFSETPPVGSNTYTVSVVNDNDTGSVIANRSIIYLETKK